MSSMSITSAESLQMSYVRIISILGCEYEYFTIRFALGFLHSICARNIIIYPCVYFEICIYKKKKKKNISIHKCIY